MDKAIKNYILIDCTEQKLASTSDRIICNYASLNNKGKCFAHEHFIMIAGILLFVGIEKQRCSIIASIVAVKGVSKQTIRNYLWLYLVHQEIFVLALRKRQQNRPLAQGGKICDGHSISSSIPDTRIACPPHMR